MGRGPAGRQPQLLGEHREPGREPVEAYWRKYGAEMEMPRAAVEEFLLAHASFEVVPERAFGIIERAEDFSQRATRWRW